MTQGLWRVHGVSERPVERGTLSGARQLLLDAALHNTANYITGLDAPYLLARSEVRLLLDMAWRAWLRNTAVRLTTHGRETKRSRPCALASAC